MPTWRPASPSTATTGPAVGAIYDGAGLRARRHGLGRRAAGRRPRAASSAPGCCSRSGCPAATPPSREPWRMACAWLAAASDDERPRIPAALAGGRAARAGRRSASSCAAGSRSPLTTSAGRLFDAVAAICGIRASVNYEGQAAVELEAASAVRRARAPTRCRCSPANRRRRPASCSTRARRSRRSPPTSTAGAAVAPVGARFHNALAAATAEACAREARARGDRRCVVLSGGVFQNRLLLERTAALLRAAAAARCSCPQRLPPNDGGISYGQAAVAAAAARR